MNSSTEINELATALSKAQSVMDYATKGSKNPFFKSTYASLADCWDVCREPLSSNGLAIIQTCIPSDKNEVIVETILTHSSGQWISSTLAMPVMKNDCQSFGSALTYNRRYSLCSLVGISPSESDDDGNLAAASVQKKIVRTTITPEANKLISECTNAIELEDAYKAIIGSITSTAEKQSLVSICKLKKDSFIVHDNAEFIAEIKDE